MLKNNEKGSTLITVLLVFMIFMTLGLAVMAASINGAKRTESRETNIVENLDDLKAMKEGLGIIEGYIAAKGADLVKKDILTYKTTLASFINDQNDKQQAVADAGNTRFTISDITESEFAGFINPVLDYTRVFAITAGPYKQNVYVTAMPSFLKYAVGSRAALTLNGSASIDGNIYASESLNISNEAQYIYNENNKLVKTQLPVAKNEVEVFVDSQTVSLCSSELACYDDSFAKKDYTWKPINSSQLNDAFSDGNPSMHVGDKPNFIDVDILQTFLEKLNGLGLNIPYFPDGTGLGKEEYSRLKKNHLITEIQNITASNINVAVIKNFHNISQHDEKALLYQGDANIDTHDLELRDDQWLIVNGNARLESSGNSHMDVKGNILITGDLTVKGDLGFSSVIYALGDTDLNSVNITCYKRNCGDTNGTLILMTQGQLDIAIVNKFKDAKTEKTNIQGYLYTDSKAEVYAVGSLLSVNGGIFSYEDLNINSYRGNASDASTDLRFTADEHIDASRLTVKNDNRLFLNQLQGLPKASGLEVIPERLEINEE
ncbi:hypothetical protein [Peribacillus sp. SCS-155]|uniref:hypothetical protein n=1 Tax=Peribacillus sedimenti TaxID=3115297 RepID=UPI00390673E6